MKKLIIVSGILMSAMFAPSVLVTTVFSATGDATTVTTGKLQNPLKSDYDTFSKFTAGVVKTAVNVMLPFVVLGFIYSGFIFVKAQGNEKELEAAKTAIWYSVIGAFILFGAWGFAQIISTTVSTLTETTTPAPAP